MASIDEVINRIKENGGEFSAKILQEILGKYEGRFDDLLDVEGLLKRIASDLTDEDVFSRSSRNRDYPNSYWDSSEASQKGFNLIPSNKKGSCAKECITIFERPQRVLSLNQPESPFVDLINYWFSCHWKNEETLILINGSEEVDARILINCLITLSETYSKTHAKSVFIVVVTKTGIELAYDYGKLQMNISKYNL